MSTVKADNFTWKSGQAGGLTGTNVTGDQIVYGVTKAWVNFNGVSGAVSRASFGVSSLTRGSTGVYTVTTTNAFSDSNYSCVYMWGGTASIAAGRTYEDTTPRTSSSITICVVNSSLSLADAAYISVNFNR